MKDATKAVTAGRRPHDNHGVVNPPVYHASTILYPTLRALRDSRAVTPGDGVTYGVHGTPGSFAFEQAVTALEGGYRTRLCQSGLTAATAPLLAYLSAGDHLLMTDSVYEPTRRFCNGMLRRMGVDTTFYDPLIGAGIAELMRPNTRVVFLESPGSGTFEVQDAPAIAEVAADRGAWSIIDNTWASPLYFKPFDHGVDVSVQAATKYVAGHSDLVMGTVTANKAAYPHLQRAWQELGLSAGPDDVYLAMRGLRTIETRLRRHWENGVRMAEWLRGQPDVVEVLHPAMSWDAGHGLWKRDFLGSSGLFGFVLSPDLSSEAHLSALLDRLELFGMGYSWGGYESLIVPVDPRRARTATAWPRPGRPDGQLMRIHVGLEDVDDLIQDLKCGFERVRAV